jgi:hypothetical protein
MNYNYNHSFYILVDWNLNQPILEDKARYAGLLQAPAEGFGLWVKLDLNMLFWPFCGLFWFPVVTLVTFSINHSNFQKNNNKKKSKISKNLKNKKNKKKSEKIQQKKPKKSI